MGGEVTICDVGPRDGLQSRPALPPKVRAELCERLARAGLPRVEAVSFVDDRKVPAMAGAEDVMAQLAQVEGTLFTGLVLNEAGFERAMRCGLAQVQYVLPATDGFGMANQGRTVEAAAQLGELLIARGRESRVRVSVAVSVAFGCPYEGRVEADRVIALAERMIAAGAEEIVLADTIGVAVPVRVAEMIGRLAPAGVRIGGHFHDTRGAGVTNALTAIDSGAMLIEAAVGGLGGCPFAPGATGNLATEELVHALDGSVDTGVDLAALVECAHWLADRLGVELPGRLQRAGAGLAGGASSVAPAPSRAPRQGFSGRQKIGRSPCLVVVDLCEGFTRPESALACDADSALGAVGRLLDAARAAERPVAFTTIAYDEGSRAAASPWLEKVPALEALSVGSRWSAIDSRIAPLSGEPVFAKLFASGFAGTPLATFLALHHCDSVVIAGASTSGCVRATVVDAMQHGYRVVVPHEAVADRDLRAHDASLDDIDGRYGDVVGLEEALERLRGSHRSEPASDGTIAAAMEPLAEEEIQWQQ